MSETKEKQVKTRSDRNYETFLTHFMEKTCKIKKEDPISLSLEIEGITDIFDFLNLSPDEIPGLVFEKDNEEKALPRASQRKLKKILKYAHFVKDNGTPWMETNESTFDNYVHSNDFLDHPLNVQPSTPDDASSVHTQLQTLLQANLGSNTSDASKFRSNVKLDIKQFPTFDGKVSGWNKFQP